MTLTDDKQWKMASSVLLLGTLCFPNKQVGDASRLSILVQPVGIADLHRADGTLRIVFPMNS